MQRYILYRPPPTATTRQPSRFAPRTPALGWLQRTQLYTFDNNYSNRVEISIDANYQYNYSIDFGDGVVLTNQTGKVIHGYSNPGKYTIKITGLFPYGQFKDNILSIDQWGDIQWASMSSSFVGCEKLVIEAIDAPDLSQVTNMDRMFSDCDQFNSNINHWDVSNITDLSRMFKFASSFNQDISSWLFNSNSNLLNFLDDSDLDYTNYDLLLSNLLSSNIQGLSMGVQGLLYCNELNRNDLINTKGWSLLGDHHLINCSNTFNSGDFVIYITAFP